MAKETGKVNIIVLLKGYKSLEGRIRADAPELSKMLKEEIRSRQARLSCRIDPRQFETTYRYENILGLTGRATFEGIRSLALLDDVEIIQEDGKAFTALAQGIPLINASAVRTVFTGAGVSVAVVDTGIDYNHPMLGGGGFPNSKVLGGYDFGDNEPDPLDCDGHGTQVAGITATAAANAVANGIALFAASGNGGIYSPASSSKSPTVSCSKSLG